MAEKWQSIGVQPDDVLVKPSGIVGHVVIQVASVDGMTTLSRDEWARMKATVDAILEANK